jgi:Ca2+-dependent lipid-binding protein
MAIETSAVQSRLERNIKLRIGEVRNIPPPARELRGKEGRDSYVIVALDREEIFRTATAEKSLSPFFGEEFGFLVPRDFRQLSFCVMANDCLPLSRDVKIGKVAIHKDALITGEAKEDKWYRLQPIDLDSEVQGTVHLSFSYREKFEDGQTHFELSVK